MFLYVDVEVADKPERWSQGDVGAKRTIDGGELSHAN